MSSALQAVQQSLVASLENHQPLVAEISGVFDGPPPRAVFPYIALTTGASLDWSHKTGVGRALTLGLTVHDTGSSAARLHRVMALVEEALADGIEEPQDWTIVTFRFRRTRIVRSATGPWFGIVEYRARCLQS
ncbi:DUF3168 domain-containing protein [Parasphingorhabdus sp.]|uniref:DUF3168 domain-containing protein n=1 Tax=Parasphingorhabdus sp. TaxID=2709688 RepID=UPI003264CE92